MAIKQAATIWRNGSLIPWEQATIHVLTHTLHYGSCVFEGIRAYNTCSGTRVFRLEDHIQRLFESARIYRMEPNLNKQTIIDACYTLLEANNLSDAYIRPLIYYGYGGLGVLPSADVPLEVTIAAFEWGAYLGEQSRTQGVDVGVSSWQRPAPNTLPAMAKAGGNYLSSRLIGLEAKRHGYHEGLALDTQGYLSEGPGENLFLVRDGIIYTPPLHSSILAGITRDSVMKIAQQLGYEVKQEPLPREFLYVADEAFFTGTAAEVVPIRSIDGQPVGSATPGPVCNQIQKAFYGLFDGSFQDSWGWLESPNLVPTC